MKVNEITFMWFSSDFTTPRINKQTLRNASASELTRYARSRWIFLLRKLLNHWVHQRSQQRFYNRGASKKNFESKSEEIISQKRLTWNSPAYFTFINHSGSSVFAINIHLAHNFRAEIQFSPRRAHWADWAEIISEISAKHTQVFKLWHRWLVFQLSCSLWGWNFILSFIKSFDRNLINAKTFQKVFIM